MSQPRRNQTFRQLETTSKQPQFAARRYETAGSLRPLAEATQQLASAPRFLGPSAVNALQRTLGNRSVRRLLDLQARRRVQRQEAGTAPATAESTNLRPPAKNSQPTSENVRALREWLMVHVAGHALAATTYTFYEVIDQYLGPWGGQGYPIAYGKRYNILFTTNRTLMANPTARRWVWRTTILLQEALANFIVRHYRAGTLAQLTEAELRAAAFESHPQAYTDGGLAIVAATAPELIPVIAAIPGAEFNLESRDFWATVEQVVVTGKMVVPRVLSNLIAAAIPAHSGGLRITADRDRRAFMARIQLNRYLAGVRRAIESGRVNDIRSLNQITRELLRHEYPDQGFTRAANEIVALANRRKRELARQYAAAIQSNSNLATAYDRLQPGWRQWLGD
jgi:hypothetical protein